MTELISAAASWQSLVTILIVFGLAPGILLRLILLVYPKGDPRRIEHLASLYKMSWWERPLFVASQLEGAVSDGLPLRFKAYSKKKQAVERNRMQAEIMDEDGVTHEARVSQWDCAATSSCGKSFLSESYTERFFRGVVNCSDCKRYQQGSLI
ncbi:hypothetical protein [Saccharopolyspora gregorii]